MGRIKNALNITLKPKQKKTQMTLWWLKGTLWTFYRFVYIQHFSSEPLCTSLKCNILETFALMRHLQNQTMSRTQSTSSEKLSRWILSFDCFDKMLHAFNVNVLVQQLITSDTQGPAQRNIALRRHSWPKVLQGTFKILMSLSFNIVLLSGYSFLIVILFMTTHSDPFFTLIWWCLNILKQCFTNFSYRFYFYYRKNLWLQTSL